MRIDLQVKDFSIGVSNLIDLSGAQFIIHLFDFRRGEEQIVYLPKTGWELREEDGFKAFFKSFSDPDKSNQENIGKPSF